MSSDCAARSPWTGKILTLSELNNTNKSENHAGVSKFIPTSQKIFQFSNNMSSKPGMPNYGSLTAVKFKFNKKD